MVREGGTREARTVARTTCGSEAEAPCASYPPLGTSRGNAAGLDGWASGDVESAVLIAGFAGACAQHASAHGSLDARDACTSSRSGATGGRFGRRKCLRKLSTTTTVCSRHHDV